MLSIICFCIAILGYYIIYKYSNDSMHPLAIMNFMWFFPAGFAFITQRNWNPITVVIIFLAGLVIIFTAIISNLRNEDLKQYYNYEFEVNDTYRLITRIVFLMCFVATILTLRSNGWNLRVYTLNTAFDRKSSITGYTNSNSLIVAYLMQYVPYCALNSIFEIVYSRKTQKKLIYNSFVILFSVFTAWFVSYSRGTLLILLVGGLWIVNSKKSIKLKYLGMAGAGILVLFFVLITLRVDSASYVYNGKFNSPFLNATYNYLADSYVKFDEIVCHGSSYTIVTNTFQALFKLFGYKTTSNTYDNYILQGRPSTFLNIFYEDGGIVMCVLYTMLQCAIINLVYYKAKHKAYYILLASNLEKAIFVVFYANYLFTFFTIIAQYIITFIICFVSIRFSIKTGETRYKIKLFH